MYRHTQSAHGLVMIVVAAVGLPVGAVLVSAPPEVVAGRIIGLAVLLIVAFCAAIFSRMTVAVGDGELSWHFAFGMFRKSIPLAEVTAVEATRTSLLDGWGIHLTQRGWLYNVAGRHAVWVRVRSGRDFLLGTDRSHDLARAIEDARARPSEHRPETSGTR